jgi:hypothetical protein
LGRLDEDHEDDESGDGGDVAKGADIGRPFTLTGQRSSGGSAPGGCYCKPSAA